MSGARFAQHGTVFEIELVREGATLVERRFGAELSADTRTLPTERAATRAFHERSAELIETKWRRVSGCEALDEIAPHPELVKAAATGDPSAIAVYNDWLLDQGDARGELAALRTAPPTTEVTARIAEVEREYGIELFGLLAVLGSQWWAQFDLEWRHGWIDKVTAHHRFMTDGRAMTASEAREALHHLLHAPVARFVRHLALDPEFAEAARVTLAGCPHCDGIQTLTMLEPGPRGDDVVSAFPFLRRLEVYGGLSGLGHSHVETLAIRVHPDAHAELRGEWPALRALEITVATPDREALASIGSLLRSKSVAHVTHLTIASDRFVPAAVVGSLVESPILGQLRALVIAAPLHPSLRERVQATMVARGIALELR